jgi:hypothetical protein
MAFALSAMPMTQVFANDDNDDFGIWTSIDASKKLTDTMKFGIEGEFRTTDGVKEVDRRSLGMSLSYKPLSWLKADIGYIFMNAYEPAETKSEFFDVVNGADAYSTKTDHAYRVNKDRLYVSLTGSFKYKRLEFSIRERLQYTYTNDAFTTEDKAEWYYKDPVSFSDPMLDTKTEVEQKDAKRNTTLRSRLTVKWDIKKCPIKPFVSAELFTRTDEWRFHDKIRYRAGADYKIDKDNSFSVYYIYQNANDDDEPAGHAIGASYSFDL